MVLIRESSIFKLKLLNRGSELQTPRSPCCILQQGQGAGEELPRAVRWWNCLLRVLTSETRVKDSV